MFSKIMKKAERFMYQPSKADPFIYILIVVACYIVAITKLEHGHV